MATTAGEEAADQGWWPVQSLFRLCNPAAFPLLGIITIITRFIRSTLDRSSMLQFQVHTQNNSSYAEWIHAGEEEEQIWRRGNGRQHEWRKRNRRRLSQSIIQSVSQSVKSVCHRRAASPCDHTCSPSPSPSRRRDGASSLCILTASTTELRTSFLYGLLSGERGNRTV